MKGKGEPVNRDTEKADGPERAADTTESEDRGVSEDGVAEVTTFLEHQNELESGRAADGSHLVVSTHSQLLIDQLHALDPSLVLTLERAPDGELVAKTYTNLPEDIDDFVEGRKRDNKLSKGELSVLKRILTKCRDENTEYVYLKWPELAKATGQTSRHKKNNLDRLIALGIIEKVADYSPKDRRGTLYRFIFRRPIIERIRQEPNDENSDVYTTKY